MPRYDYVCTMCGCPVEKGRRYEDRDTFVECPECKASCGRVMSNFSKTPTKWS